MGVDNTTRTEDTLIVTAIFILVALVTFGVTALFCFCCPFCIVPKVKKRRAGRVKKTSVVNQDEDPGNSGIRQPQVLNNIRNSDSPEINSQLPKQKNEQRQRKLNSRQEHLNANSLQMTQLNVHNNGSPPLYSNLNLQIESENLPYNPNFSRDKIPNENPTAPPTTPTASKK